MNEALTPQLQEWLSVRDEHINQLQDELARAHAALHEAHRQKREINAVRAEHTAFVNAAQQKTTQMEQELHQWQHDYEQLRIQKGGFGFKMLLASGTLAWLVGLLAGWLVFRQKDSNEALFRQFVKASGFNLEYNLTHEQYNDAHKIVQTYQQNETFAPVRAELDFIAALIAAVQLHGDSTLHDIGYSVTSDDTISTRQPQPKRTLVITYGTVHVRTEALPDAPILAALVKKDKVGQWDRTAELAKMRTTDAKGRKGIAEDYWYEVETPDGQKGWLFGFFTNASLQRFKADSLEVKREMRDER